MVVKNYYKILDLETSHVSIDEIRQAYRQAAKKYHPDLNIGDNLAEEKIKDINEAYKILSVPSSKRKYDRMWNAKFGKGKKAFSDKSQKGAIFNIFLGNIENTGTDEKIKKNPIKGENVETEINVNIYDAFYGLEKQIALKTVEGQTKTYTVKIPKGIRNGEKIRLIGQGKTGKYGGFDLYTYLLLTPWEAALGTRTTVKAIDDETNIYVPEGIESGEKIRIPNKGYYIDKEKRGDLVEEVKIVVQKHLTEEERNVYQKLEKISKFNPRA